MKVGDRLLESEIKHSDTMVQFDLNLPKGETEVEAWLVDGDGNEKQAYYVYIRKT